MCTQFFALGLTILIGISSVHAQTMLPKKKVDEQAISALKEEDIEDYYTKLRAVLRSNTPRVIFVPGILGSKIDECQPDGSQCKPIWGTVRSITNTSIDLGIRPDKSYRSDVVDEIFFQDIYGGILNTIRARITRVTLDTPDDPLLTVFHYDWRLSNKNNATHLAERICQVRQTAPDSPIILVGHSMGGLMVKIWAKYYAESACPSGSKPKVSQLIFVATPHLGSPKTIKALVEGYNIYFDELSGLKRYLGWFERNYLLKAVNAAGMGFQSYYELMPIQASELCRSKIPELQNLPSPLDGDDGKPLNVFNIDNWKKYDLLRQIENPTLRRSYYDGTIADMLRKAEQLLCDMATFDPTSVAPVTYLVGREKEDRTYGWFLLKLSGPLIAKFTSVAGDGTVPLYSAQNALISRTKQIYEIADDHVGIVSSPRMMGLVESWYATAVARSKLQIAAANVQLQPVVTAEVASTGDLLPVSLDASAWSAKENQLAISLNTKALNLMGYTSADVASAASSKLDPEQRAALFAVAASTADVPEQKLAWTGEVAQSAYAAGRFDDAIGSSGVLTTWAQTELPKDSTQAVALQKQAKEILGWSYLRGGDIQNFSMIAREFATTGQQLKEPGLPYLSPFNLPSDEKHLMAISPPERAWGG